MTEGFWPDVWHRRQWWRPFADVDEYRAWVDAGRPPECECPRDDVDRDGTIRHRSGMIGGDSANRS